MMKLNPQRRGFSIIEVLVAILVLALGILAVVKLQGVLIQSASDSTQRAFAVSLAQQKIDDLRGFTEKTTLSECTYPSQVFECIDINLGGQILPATDGEFSIERESYRYSLAWEVEDYFYLTSNVADEPVSGVPGDGTIPDNATPAFKIVNVLVAWVDETNTQQQVALETIIDSYPPGLTSLSGDPSPGGVPPQASYTPEGAPDVIDIAVDTGESTKRQTSKPLPDVVKTGQAGNTIVSFDVMTYEPREEGSSEDFVATRQEEFVTVDCNCQLSSDVGPALTPAHAVWDDVSKTRRDVMGKWVSKQTAVQVANANDAEDLCAVCCRDHHDADVSPVKYVPNTEGNHKHYDADGNEATIAGDPYTESCRLKRVDGILRVYQDWNLLDITIMDRLQLIDSSEGSLQMEYQEYVEDLILSQFPFPGGVTADKPLLRTPVVTNEGVKQQLESRGVYLDAVYDSDGSPSEDYLDYLLADDPVNTDRLEKVPFAEVNLTLLSNWSTANDTKVLVDNEPVATIAEPDLDYYGTYRRGWLSALETTDGDGVAIDTSMRANNDGFTQLDIDSSVAKKVDQVKVKVEAGGSPLTISGEYSITFPDKVKASVTIQSVPEGLCSLPGKPGDTYECSVQSPWSGQIQIKATATQGKDVVCSGESVPFNANGLSGTGDPATYVYNFAPFTCD